MVAMLAVTQRKDKEVERDGVTIGANKDKMRDRDKTKSKARTQTHRGAAKSVRACDH